jgi:hypothetical protein
MNPTAADHRAVYGGGRADGAWWGGGVSAAAPVLPGRQVDNRYGAASAAPSDAS